jgi:hypothetical protein
MMPGYLLGWMLPKNFDHLTIEVDENKGFIALS